MNLVSVLNENQALYFWLFRELTENHGSRKSAFHESEFRQLQKGLSTKNI